MRTWYTMLVCVALAAGTAEARQATPDPFAIGSHVVRTGESLQQITAFYLGDPSRWRENWQLNPALTDPDRLVPGQRIRVLRDPQRRGRTASLSKVARRVDTKPEPIAWLPALTGDVLRTRDGVRTFASSSAELEFDDGVRIQLTEDSLIFLREAGGVVRGEGRRSLEVSAGQADLQSGVGPTPSGEIEVVLGAAVARPRTTAAANARLRRTTAGGSQIMVYVGDSTIEAGGAIVAVPGGMGTLVSSQGPPSAPVALLPAPTLLQPAIAAVSPVGNPTLSWQAVRGAVGYVIEVCGDAQCGALVAKARATATTLTPGLPAGSWFWRVTAVAANGLDGFPSAPRPLTVASDRVLGVLAGTVREDRDGTGALAAAAPAAGVVVSLYDAAQNLDTPGSSPVATTRTDADGRFSFSPAAPAEYWVTVGAASIAPGAGLHRSLAPGAARADQTYGPAGSLCADAAGAVQPLRAAGPCFGGRTTVARDNHASLSTSRHVARVRLEPSAPADLAFAFSFNVVTTADDAPAGLVRQGSLRQFLLNAAAIVGPNSMRFVPAGAPTARAARHSWWRVTLTADLPALSDAATAVDGRSQRPGRPPGRAAVTQAQLVGTVDHALRRPDLADLEIDGAGFAGLSIAATGVTVRNLAIHSARSSPALSTGERAPAGPIAVHGSGEATLDNLMIGARADGSRLPRGEVLSYSGLGIYDRARATATRLLVADHLMYGVLVQSDTSDARLDASDLEVTGAGFESAIGDGIGLHSNGSRVVHAYVHGNGNDGTAKYDGGAGIEMWGDRSIYGQSADGNTVLESSIVANGRGITISTNAVGNVVERSVISANRKSGVLLNSYTRQFVPSRNRISANTFIGNGGAAIAFDPGIDPAGADPAEAINDGARRDNEPNDGLDAPRIEQARVADGRLRVAGYVGTAIGQAAFARSTIELYDAARGRFIGQGTAGEDGAFSVELPLTGAPPAEIRALAIDARGNTSPLGPAAAVVR